MPTPEEIRKRLALAESDAWAGDTSWIAELFGVLNAVLPDLVAPPPTGLPPTDWARWTCDRCGTSAMFSKKGATPAQQLAEDALVSHLAQHGVR